MNFNVEKLRELIRAGKTNEEIKNIRLDYLKSENYKMMRNETVKEYGTDQVLFHDGFIDSDLSVAYRGNMATEIVYRFDEHNDVYDCLIDYIRQNMDKKGMNFKGLMQLVRNYFALDINSEYGKVVNLLRNASPNNKYFAREELPYIIQYYSNSNFNGSLYEFSQLYLDYLRFSYTNKEDYKARSDEFRNSIDWPALDEDPDIKLNLSNLKGVGIAACTEYSMLMQNCLAFLGYDCYMLGGKLKRGKKEEAHNFNVYVTSKGEYKIIDVAQYCWSPALLGITSIEELSNIQNYQTDNLLGDSIIYSSGSIRKNKTI